jgi:hypothetical protein
MGPRVLVSAPSRRVLVHTAPSPVLIQAAVLLALAIAATASASGRPKPERRPLPGVQAPAGYFVDSLDAVTPRPVWEEAKDGDFTYSIRRVFSDSTEQRMLRIAEAVYPPRDALAGIAARAYYEMGSDTAGVPLWWCRGIGARRIPYAVTAGTMEHFLRLTQRWRHHNFWETGMGGGLWWSDMIYHANVTAAPSFTDRDREFTNVYLVQLVFAWSYDDGTFVPVTETMRTVVLSRRGDVLAVEGDGRADEQVRLSEHRRIGYQSHIMR